MFKRLLIVIVALLLTGLVAISCTPLERFIGGGEDGEWLLEEEEGEEGVLPGEVMRLTTFYFPDEGNNFVVPFTQEIPRVEGIGRLALEQMVEGVKSQEFLQGTGLRAPFPSGTEIRGLTIRDGLARVDFSKDFLNYSLKDERLVITSLLYTLTEFPTVDRVELQVEGKTMTALPGGTSIGEVMTRNRGINLEIVADLEDFQRTSRLIVYFNTRLGEEQRHYYVPISRIIPATDNLPQVAIEELLRGSRPGLPLYSAIPAETMLKDLTVGEETVSVNLSSELLNFKGGAVAAEHILDQLVLTLTELPEIRKVQIFVGGEPTILTGDIELSRLHSRPAKINY